MSLSIPNREFRQTFGYTIQGLCLFPVFITAVRYPEWGVMQLLNVAWVRWIGLLSYAIYLVHPAMLGLFKAVVGKSFVSLTLMAAVLTVANPRLGVRRT